MIRQERSIDPFHAQAPWQGIPDVIPAEACYLGWQESLRNLAKLVEPEINQ